MRLTDIEEAMARGEQGAPRQWAIQHMQQVGRAFDAADFVEVHQAHIMADTESLGEAGVAFLERLGEAPPAERRVRVPTITDPRGTDFAHYRKLGQTDAMAALERRAIDAFEALGVLMTDTCINYQTIMPPLPGEHQAYGDTGVVIYSNSVLGARSNFEGGPSALAAALTGRTPRYGLHLDENRRGTHRFTVSAQPNDLAEWGALGALIGRAAGSYWAVPVIEGIDAPPGSDALKHMGAAMASFGSIPLFHIVGITPEAPTLEAVCDPASLPVREIGPEELRGLFGEYGAPGEKVDVVVFAAPQLSLVEMQQVADLLDGRRIHDGTALLVATSPGVAADADRMRLTERIEASGALVLRGMCFYQSYAREMGIANGWRRLLTNSAKLVNILGGYGYAPSLMSMAACVDAAVGAHAMSAPRLLRCHVGVGPVAEGEALVTDDNFSARYDLDRIKGIFSRPQHKLHGQSYVGKVLVVNTAKGGVASAWMLHEMAARGLAPVAILFNRFNPILAQGAALADMAICDRFADGDITRLIETGERVKVDPAAGLVTVG